MREQRTNLHSDSHPSSHYLFNYANDTIKQFIGYAYIDMLILNHQSDLILFMQLNPIKVHYCCPRRHALQSNPIVVHYRYPRRYAWQIPSWYALYCSQIPLWSTTAAQGGMHGKSHCGTPLFTNPITIDQNYIPHCSTIILQTTDRGITDYKRIQSFILFIQLHIYFCIHAITTNILDPFISILLILPYFFKNSVLN